MQSSAPQTAQESSRQTLGHWARSRHCSDNLFQSSDFFTFERFELFAMFPWKGIGGVVGHGRCHWEFHNWGAHVFGIVCSDDTCELWLVSQSTSRLSSIV